MKAKIEYIVYQTERLLDTNNLTLKRADFPTNRYETEEEALVAISMCGDRFVDYLIVKRVRLTID